MSYSVEESASSGLKNYYSNFANDCSCEDQTKQEKDAVATNPLTSTAHPIETSENFAAFNTMQATAQIFERVILWAMW